MSFASIIEVSLFPIPKEDFMEESTIWATNPNFVGDIADYIRESTLDRDTSIREMANNASTSLHQSYEIGEDAHGKFILVKSKADFFRPLWEAFKKNMESTISLDKFISYRGEDDKFGDYIFADGELMVFPEFIRRCVVGEPYYIGGIVDYHS